MEKTWKGSGSRLSNDDSIDDGTNHRRKKSKFHVPRNVEDW